MNILDEEEQDEFSFSLDHESLTLDNLHKIEIEVQKTLQVEGDSSYSPTETSEIQFNEEGIVKNIDRPDFGNFLSSIPSSPSPHSQQQDISQQQSLIRHLFKSDSPAPNSENRSPSPFLSFFQSPSHPPSSPPHQVTHSPLPPVNYMPFANDISTSTINLLLSTVTSLTQRIDSMDKRMQDQQQQIIQLQTLLGLVSTQALQHQEPETPSVSQTPVNYATSSSVQTGSATPTISAGNSASNNNSISSRGAGTYYCAEHNKSFTTSSNYQRHLREVHNKKKRGITARSSTPMRPQRPEDEDMKEEEDENLTQEMSTLNVK